MNSFIGWCIGTLLVFLTGWGSLQKRKVNKATERAREAEQRAKAAELNLKVAETAAKEKRQNCCDPESQPGEKEVGGPADHGNRKGGGS